MTVILVEGLPGSGKSTVASHLSEWLREQGYRTRCHCEMDADNPILLDHPDGLPGFMDGVLRSWRDFREQDQVTVFESRFWQNTTASLLRSGLDPALILRFQQEVEAALTPCQPLLIHLRRSDHQELLRELELQRGTVWVDWIVARDSQEPWFRQRALADRSGWVLFWSVWQDLVAGTLQPALTMPVLELDNPHTDWARSRGQILEAARTHLSAVAGRDC